MGQVVVLGSVLRDQGLRGVVFCAGHGFVRGGIWLDRGMRLRWSPWWAVFCVYLRRHWWAKGFTRYASSTCHQRRGMRTFVFFSRNASGRAVFAIESRDFGSCCGTVSRLGKISTLESIYYLPSLSRLPDDILYYSETFVINFVFYTSMIVSTKHLLRR